MTYWEGTGRYEKENKILWEKYIPSSGINLTKDNSLNRLIKVFRKHSKQYYRYYNDGDRVPGVTRSPDKVGYNKIDKEKLERRMDIAILRLWKKSKGGTVPVDRSRNN